MSIVEYIGDSSPRGIIKHWERKTKSECAYEIERCYRRISELEKRKPPQDVEEFIAKHAYQDGHDRFSCRCVSVEALTDWMAGYARVPVGWQFYQDGKWWHGDDRIKDHRKNTEEAGFPVRDVYAASVMQGEPVGWLYEDELPDSYPYETMFPYSKVDGVRMFPVYAPQTAEQQTVLTKYQPCGCVLCTCEHETQCQGCGAKHCGTHLVGQIPGPVYQQPAPDMPSLTEALHAECEKLRKDAERYGYIREGNHWIVAATQTGVHLDGKNLDDLIDDEIADAMLSAHKEK